MPNLKRTINDTSIIDDVTFDNDEPLKKQIKLDNNNNNNRKKRSVKFNNVNVYYFQRQQGFICIPSTGTNTVGMAYNHIHEENYTIDDYTINKRKEHLELIEKNYYVKKELIKNLNKYNESDEDNEEFIDNLNLKNLNELNNVNNDLPINTDFFCPLLTHTERTRLIKLNCDNKIDTSECGDIKLIRKSREICGCMCKDTCEKDTCSCMLNGIGCQLDKAKYPCACSIKRCKNPFGLKCFNQRQVRKHYDNILYNNNTQLINDEELNVKINNSKKRIKLINTCLDLLPYQPFDLLKTVTNYVSTCSAS